MGVLKRVVIWVILHVACFVSGLIFLCSHVCCQAMYSVYVLPCVCVCNIYIYMYIPQNWELVGFSFVAGLLIAGGTLMRPVLTKTHPSPVIQLETSTCVPALFGIEIANEPCL